MTKETKSTCPEAVIRQIRSLLDDKKSWMQLSEFDIRASYILPMFKHLGWNINNEDLSPFEFEVLREQSIRSGRPDITFRIQGLSVFFVETKNIKKISQIKMCFKHGGMHGQADIDLQYYLIFCKPGL